MVQQWQKGTYRLTQVPPESKLLDTKNVESRVIECYTTSDPGLVHSLQLLPAQMQLLFARRSLKRMPLTFCFGLDSRMPTSPKRLTSSNASSMGGISAFTAKFMCHFGMNASTILNPVYIKSVTEVLQGTHNS